MHFFKPKIIWIIPITLRFYIDIVTRKGSENEKNIEKLGKSFFYKNVVFLIFLEHLKFI
jgi:hypothetical protein